ncbi:MAG: divergent polysaccharide deacetylase family protein [Deltaproteobacteria bacterium]|nr:divergent polysaccharide deacetylase family protein [Deltaproteobacteria bacterium]
MAKKKPQTKQNKINQKSGKGKNSANQKNQIMRLITGLAVLILIVSSAGFIANYYIKSSGTEQNIGHKPLDRKHLPDKPLARKPSSHKPPLHKPQPRKTFVKNAPQYEVFPAHKDLNHKPVSLPVPKKPDKTPQVAIIIDDIGYDRKIANKFIKLDVNLTFSVLPHSPFAKQIVDSARKNGIEIMLHLPMEPIEYPRVNPGPGALLTSMSPDQLIKTLNDDLNFIPSIKGVNNHMGSKMTAESDRMNQIFSILKKRGLFFIDSRTTAETTCRSSARLLKIPFAERNIFIDHIQTPDFIRKQIKRLLNAAIQQGEVVGIAHPYTLTYKIFSEMLPDIKKKVKIVSASAIVHRIG